MNAIKRSLHVHMSRSFGGWCMMASAKRAGASSGRVSLDWMKRRCKGLLAPIPVIGGSESVV